MITITSTKPLEHCCKADFTVNLGHTFEVGLRNSLRTEDDVLMNSNMSADHEVMMIIT